MIYLIWSLSAVCLHLFLINLGVGDLEMLQYLINHDHELTIENCGCAARHNRLEIVDFCRKRGLQLSNVVTSQAARGGHFELLLYLRRHNAEFDEETLIGGIEGGHRAVIKWLMRTVKCPCGRDSCAEA